MRRWLAKHPVIRRLVRIVVWIVLTILTLIILAVATFYIWVENSRNNLIYNAIPPEFEVSDTIFQKGKFWGFCGVGMYKLPPHIIARIEQEGLLFLNTARTVKLRDKEAHSHEWEETPIDLYGENYGESWWAVPPSCAKLDKRWGNRIYEALHSPGNYYAFIENEPYALIVLPKFGRIMVFYFEL